jgi:hypothetical protein
MVDIAVHNQAMEMIMSTNSNAASGWLNDAELPDWPKQIGETVRTAFEALNTGRAALHDYRKLAVHGIAPQDASKTVFQRHFGKR